MKTRASVRFIGLVAAVLTVSTPAEPAAAWPVKPPSVAMLAGSHAWLLFGRYTYDAQSWGEKLVDLQAINRSRSAEISLAGGHFRDGLSLVGSLVTGVTDEAPGRVYWTDLDTGASGEGQLPPDTAYVAGSADGWLAQGPQGLVDMSRSGDLRVIDPDPPRFGRYAVSGRGFTVTDDYAVTYRSWRRLDVAHVFRPERHKDERLFCSDLSAKAILCTMDREYCPPGGCDDEPRTHHRPYYIPLEEGPPVRSPFLGHLLHHTVTGQTFNSTTLRWDFRTWHASTGKVTTAEAPTSDYVETTGRAFGRLILQRLRFDDGPLTDQLIVATPDTTEYDAIVCSPGPCPVRRGG